MSEIKITSGTTLVYYVASIEPLTRNVVTMRSKRTYLYPSEQPPLCLLSETGIFQTFYFIYFFFAVCTHLLGDQGTLAYAIIFSRGHSAVF